MILVYQEKLQNLWKHVFWVSDLEEKVATRGLWMLNIPQQEVFVFQLFNHVWLLVTPWTEACQAPLSVGFPRQESWSGLPLSSPRDLLAPGIRSLSPALTGRFFTAELPGKPNEKDSVSKKYCLVNYPHCTFWENSDWSGYYIHWKWLISMAIYSINID